MILLLGASGYIGRAFANELRRRGDRFIPLTRKAIGRHPRRADTNATGLLFFLSVFL
jgi:nucleoside-diphosphate-sugar epimerase